MAMPSPTQRVRRFAPLADIAAAVDRLAAPLAPITLDIASAVGCVLAADIAGAGPHPAHAIAIADGWAVEAGALADAGPYAPILLPPPPWVEAGEPLPAGCDAVAAPDTILQTGALWQAIAPASPGDGVMAAGGEVPAGAVIRRAGSQLRASDAALLGALGILRVSVRRPRIAVVTVRPDIAAADDTTAPLIAAEIGRAGGIADIRPAPDDEAALQRAYGDVACDAVITIGGTGCGRHDRTVIALAQHGTLALHGMGIRPGETAGIGAAGTGPVLMLPGRLDAALAIWLVVGRHLLRRLTGAIANQRGETITLTRKIASTVGFAEFVLIRRDGDFGTPLGVGGFSLQALAQADGWLLVAPVSEGFSAGAAVTMFPLP